MAALHITDRVKSLPWLARRLETIEDPQDRQISKDQFHETQQAKLRLKQLAMDALDILVEHYGQASAIYPSFISHRCGSSRAGIVRRRKTRANLVEKC